MSLFTFQIPFSKFFFSAKGRVQDRNHQVNLNAITNFGITVADKINAPFRLELDYIGLEYDPSHTETSAYEEYRVPAFYWKIKKLPIHMYIF